MRKGGLDKVGKRAARQRSWDEPYYPQDQLDESDMRTVDIWGNVTGEDDQAYFEANGMGD